MDLYLQFGWGMKKMTLELAEKWGGATVILSPRDIEPEQLIKWKKDFKRHKVNVLFDPQCYFPKSYHPRLSLYNYWEKSLNTFLSEKKTDQDVKLIQKVKKYNEDVEASGFIIPSIMEKYSDEWLEQWYVKAKKLVEEANKQIKGIEKFLTLALPSDFLVSKEDEIEELLRLLEMLEVDGFYIVAEPTSNTNNSYLVDNPLWLSNLLQICAGLKLLSKKVILGYANHQMLCASVSKVDAIASGTFLNVRQFSHKFKVAEGETKRKTIWFYNPETLSEYKIPFLDVAFNNDVLNELVPTEGFRNEYIKLIFSGIMPSSTMFKENMAFMHYLETLKRQTRIATKDTFEKTIAHNELMLKVAEQKINYLEENGVYAQTRSFKDIIDVNRSAIQRIQKTRGFMIKHSWKDL